MQPDLFQPEKLSRAKLGIRTVRIDFDGGNGCNDPRNYGTGYGSFRIDGGAVMRVDHGRPMSNNAAEIFTLCSAIEVVSRTVDAGICSLKIIGDSQIALKWADVGAGNREVTRIAKGASSLFKESIFRLANAVRPFHSVRTCWKSRAHAVRMFGH